MFEYLMPLLFMRTYQNSLLDQACRNSVTRQIEYGRERAVAWGISEAAYSALDARQLGFGTNVVVDACRAIELKPGDVKLALDEMKQAGARLSQSSEL